MLGCSNLVEERIDAVRALIGVVAGLVPGLLEGDHPHVADVHVAADPVRRLVLVVERDPALDILKVPKPVTSASRSHSFVFEPGEIARAFSLCLVIGFLGSLLAKVELLNVEPDDMR